MTALLFVAASSKGIVGAVMHSGVTAAMVVVASHD